ncbi:cell envelope-related function transcriptional attenuator common domain-containing protein [Blastococcus tunisiensis]|uniref:Cell envelope-related function transcriptional attenuator common domain-containing protein n=1 Tax=Blastococcus tunisiensis TaxID=1798228 RepID=A0A1I1WH15_9ACTN|nr:cell envelope-related function transcriptional attenuator common domain-containing protein [Blastococcus sp. DSM 46838]
MLVLGTSGWGWYLGQVADASVNRTNAIPSEGNDGIGNTEAMNLLLVGNDSRASATEDQLDQLNTTANDGINTDTMILVHVPADGSKASFVSFPRDSYVEIPGYGWDKLNAAYAYGYQYEAADNATDAQRQASGAQLLIQTISSLTGLQIDHYAEVDLLGFFNLSSVVGGVEINLCEAVKDGYSGVNLPAGVQTISGEQALAFVRQRHGLPRGDFDRIIRQQTFIGGMIRKMLSDNVLLDLGKQRTLVQAAADSLTVDQSLDLLGLATQMQSVTAGAVEFQTVPYVGDDTDDEGRYILRLEDEDALHAFFADLSAEPEAPAGPTAPAAPETVAPGEVSVAVFNGSGISGVAASTAEALAAEGYQVTSTGNADSSEYTGTEIRYAAGDQALANTLAASIPGATIAEADEPAPGTLELVIGSNFNGVGQPVTAPEPVEPVAGEDARTAADTTCIN